MFYTDENRPFTEKPLYKLLAKSFPRFSTRQDMFDVRALAAALTMSAEGVYKWLRADRLSADGAARLLDLAKTEKIKLTRGDLATFVIR